MTNSSTTRGAISVTVCVSIAVATGCGSDGDSDRQGFIGSGATGATGVAGSTSGGGGGCESGYDPCVPSYPPDVDCANVGGPVSVSGSDPHGLDADNDGTGCE